MTIFKEMNRYPVVFIGSGMSKRYLKNYPTWDELLESYWEQINQSQNYYSYLTNLRIQYQSQYNDDELTHKINTVSAEFIEKEYNNLFNAGKITIPTLTHERVYKENISPFKYSICSRFSECELRDDIDNVELNYFKECLKKAKIIITTNYDPFIENILKEGGEEGVFYNKYIGNKGFFTDTIGYAELYKIHGDISDPHSIIINQKDYEQYDSNSILISAKILSNIIHTQIIFFGYSLTDRNVKKLLTDFSSQFPKEDDRKSARRIIIVQHDDAIQDINPVHSSNFGVSFVQIKTNNYKKIFQDISSINEGLTPSEVLRYQRIIKDLIINEGGKGNLNTILVSPTNLEQLDEKIKTGKKIVVAIGDEKIVYRKITEIAYLKNYFINKNDFSNKLAIEFIIDSTSSGRLPIAKYIRDSDFTNLGLNSSQINRINKKIEICGSLEQLINNVRIDSVTEKKEYLTIDEIKNETCKNYKKILIIIKNIKKLDKKELSKFIINDAIKLMETECSSSRTALRKLFCAYDLLINGDIEPIK